MEQISILIKTEIVAKWMKRLGRYIIATSIVFLLVYIPSSILLCLGRMDCPAPQWIGWVSMPVAMVLPPIPFLDLDIIQYNHGVHFSLYWDNYLKVVGWGLLFGILLTICSRLLFKKTKKGWIISNILFIPLIILPLLFSYLFLIISILEEGVEITSILEILGLIKWFLGIIFYIVPFIILICDSKNLWKVAT